MIEDLVSAYHAGAITADDLIAEGLSRLDPVDPDATFRQLPSSLHGWLWAVVDRLRSGPMPPARIRTIREVGDPPPVPSPAQTAAAIRWLAEVEADRHARPRTPHATPPQPPHFAARIARG